MKFRRGFTAIVAASIALSAGSVSAITLNEALVLAYQNNPSIQAARAGVRTQDETYAQAVSALRPSVAVSGSYTSSAALDNLGTTLNNLQAALSASLTIYDGGKSRDAINSTENQILAGRENLRAAEQNLLLNATIAYHDVIRGQQVVQSGQNSVRVLEQQLQAANDRFEVGATTRTDVSLTEARVAAAKSALAANRGALVAAQEAFRAIVGVAPVSLSTPAALPNLPRTQGEAESIAMREHPTLKAARYLETASEIDLSRARKVRVPTVALNGSLSYSDDNYSDALAGVGIGVSAQMPLYQGGALSSIIRQSATLMERRKAETQNAMAGVRQQVAQAWSNLQVANLSISAYQAQVRAAQAAYDGVSQETRLGARTILDLLDAEQELLNAKTGLSGGQRDVRIAGYALLAAMGLLNVETLKLGIPAYDPAINFNKVKSAPVTFSGAKVMDKIADRWGE